MNSKLLALFVAVVLMAVTAYAASLSGPFEYEVDSIAELKTDIGQSDDIPHVDHHGLRQKRATCDLLSFSPFSGPACAANCIRKGFRGGYCSKKNVCRCRK